MSHSRGAGSDIRGATIRGAGAGLASFGVLFIIRIVSTVVLARLLSPADFGLVALAAIVLNLFVRVADLGLMTASTQRYHTDQAELSALFWINVCGGLALGALMVACAPLASLLLGEPRVEPLIGILSTILVVIGLGAQHESIMRRKLQFGLLALVSPLSQLIATIVGILAAYGGLGYWSIVMMHVVARSVTTALYWVLGRWRPRKPGNFRKAWSFVRFGGSYAASQALVYLTHHLDSVVVGRIGGIVDLGLYRRSFDLLHLPIVYLRAQIDRVIPSSLSRLQKKEEEFEGLFLGAVGILVFLGCPAIGFLVMETPAVVLVLFGEKWLGMTPYVRWLSPVALVGLVEVSVTWLLVARASGKQLVAVRGMRAVSVAVGLFVGYRWGVVGAAAGYGLATLVSCLLEFWYTAREQSRLVRGAIKILWRPVVCAGIASGVVLAIAWQRTIGLLVLESLVYLTVYLVVYLALPGGRMWLWKSWQVLTDALKPSVGR